MPSSDHFTAFQNQQFLNLETFRKSGAGVPTPVWFILDQDRLYVRTPAHSGKVKRVRNLGRARVAPCDRAGNLLGEWQPASARLLTDPGEQTRVSQLLNRKYGLTKRVFDFFMALRGWKSAVIMLETPPVETAPATPPA